MASIHYTHYKVHYMRLMTVSQIAKYATDRGFNISRATLSGLLSKTSSVFDRLHEAIKTAVRAETYIGEALVRT